MAIYHFSAQVISRAKGQSAIASASYRSGERLENERTGETNFYKREVMPETMILAPSNSPEWVTDRERLWNEVEASETRKNSQLAREINVALPRELSNDDQRELIRDYVQEQFVDKGMVADIAIHRDDRENPHAHVMLTTRDITEEGFGKKNRDWNDRDLLNQWREQWAEHANKALEREGVQERISHLSHEARGLEQLPTVHLGHVSHEMENRGIETDRGNINRERQEYNRVVVDLQKYREEKKALEQKQQQERFSTPTERVQLKEASQYLKAEPTFKNTAERLQQLDKWDKNLSDNSQFLQWKDQTFKQGSEHFNWIRSFENRIQQEQQKIDNIKWFNPLKVKENRGIKEQAERQIEHLKGEIKFHDEKLNYHREKLGFKDEKEFRTLEQQYEKERPVLLNKNQQQRQALNQEKGVLQNAQKALQNRFVRQVASQYPKQPEMAYMSFKTAQQLTKLNKQYNRTFSFDEIKAIKGERDQKLESFNEVIRNTKNDSIRLQNAEGYVKGYEKANEIVQKYENNPFLKGKMMVSKSAKKEYETALNQRQQCANHMKKHGINEPKDFYRQKESSAKAMEKVPRIQEKAQSLKGSTSIVDGIFQGIQQATRAMERHKQQEKQKTMSRDRGKSKQRNLDMEMEL